MRRTSEKPKYKTPESRIFFSLIRTREFRGRSDDDHGRRSRVLSAVGDQSYDHGARRRPGAGSAVDDGVISRPQPQAGSSVDNQGVPQAPELSLSIEVSILHHDVDHTQVKSNLYSLLPPSTKKKGAARAESSLLCYCLISPATRGFFLQTNPKRHPHVLVRPLRSRCDVSPGHSRN
jgi:hypothetical protein